ncbi:hypothetical protein SAMN05443246_5286 [Paenibacillus sp. GP183]|nr:hypothetical protein SAMN05443246_5286 [Paenibacillus sp. GP183]
MTTVGILGVVHDAYVCVAAEEQFLSDDTNIRVFLF